jgi:hypothetical protein
MKKALLDKDLSKKVEMLSEDLERSSKKYSDIDLIFEKNAKQKRTTH